MGAASRERPLSKWARPLILGLVPFLLLLCGLRSLPQEEAGQRAGQRQVYPVPKFRTVVLVLDSVGTPMAFNPSLMPFVSSLTSTSLFGEAAACPGKATFPCVKSIFEGRTATTGTTLQDFSAVASKRTTWPGSLAALGLRLVLTSDHTINRLYPDAFVDTMNYETLHVPLLDRDEYAYRAARKWLDDPSVDVLLLHIIGTDKVGHEYPVGGDIYRAKFLEVDNFVREVASRLGPQDYLYVISDHGHNELGGHTEDAAYIARGPLFPHGKNENIGAADLLFLLSVPYALTLPDEYEGHIRTDLTLLPEEARARLLGEQARLWRIAGEGLSSGELEARLNEHVIRNREEGEREHGFEIMWRVAPWLVAAAFFLVSQLRVAHEPRIAATWVPLRVLGAGVLLGLAAIPQTGWVAAVGAIWWLARELGVPRTLGAACATALLGVAAFWITPSWLAWFHVGAHQPLAWSVFYPVAVLAGVAITISVGANSWREHAIRVLLVVAIAVWLLAYFGPYNYALTGRSTQVVLGILAPIAVLLAGGVRSFRSISTLWLVGFVPFVTFYTSSFNIEYRLTDRVAEMPMVVGLCFCAAVAAVLIYAIGRDGAVNGSRGTLAWAAAAMIWLLMNTALFQFDHGKLLGVLLGSLALAGFLQIFRRANLPAVWQALAGVVLLFAVFHFLLNGFALSHVDFRFATNKIIPFQQEALRAPQLIAWVVLKYLFVLLPLFAVLFACIDRATSRLLFQLGAWRELMIVLSAIGLSIFDLRGMNELCSEEVYFWTFLNLGLWLFCLVSTWPGRAGTSVDESASSRSPAAGELATAG